jgi:hypothetical protein
LFLGGVLVWRWAAGPEPCEDATVSSERFGYCISLPSGWRVADVPGEELPADQFVRPDGDTTLMIQAVETSKDLDGFSEDVRQLQEDAGLVPGEVTTVRVAGMAALRWDADLGSAPDAIRARTVVFEVDGVAWRVQFADDADAFEQHLADLGAILRSWRFR